MKDPLLCAIAQRMGIDLPSSSSDPYGIGLKNSGNEAKLLSVSPPQKVQPVDLLKRIGRNQTIENLGPALVHVSVEDASSRPIIGAPNQRIVLAVTWQTGRTGGTCRIDATGGACFSVNGTHTLDISATLESNELDAAGAHVALIPGQDKLLQANVQWGASTFQPAYLPVGSIPLAANVDSVVLDVPPQARSVVCYSDTALAVITYKAGTRAAGGGFTTRYSGDFARNQAAQPLPVVSGAEAFVLSATVICKVTAIFELWL